MKPSNQTIAALRGVLPHANARPTSAIAIDQTSVASARRGCEDRQADFAARVVIGAHGEAGNGTVALRARVADADFGAQGGDPLRLAEAGLTIDLSTCVNRYGPPPVALAALSAVVGPQLQVHPYDASARVQDAYAADLGVPASELVAGRGTTEFIWAMGAASHMRVRPFRCPRTPTTSRRSLGAASPGRCMSSCPAPT